MIALVANEKHTKIDLLKLKKNLKLYPLTVDNLKKAHELLESGKTIAKVAIKF
ncbi:hypothetical protein BC749_1313 [Flavobacterium araucananum]|uniref:hypothetical protein n=1 Tax=Flavobacterium araucananum TaxID=946678 RepID=UPI000D7A97BA|nr:hypothetical protein [Flavobacterium araucananum]PWJ88106.1 hypothetical protein BC749_1313 [Flavobacterium araucananum]